MTYVDRTLNCVDCGVEFIHSAADQEYYQQKGFVSDPKRCSSCRASRRASRDGGYDVRDIGGPRGYERGDDRPKREYFAVDLLVLRQPGAGAVQAADGPPGLLLRLLPDGPARLTRRQRQTPSSTAPPMGADRLADPERLPGAVAIAPAAAPDRDPRPAVDLPRPVAADERRLLVDPEHQRPARRLERDERATTAPARRRSAA